MEFTKNHQKYLYIVNLLLHRENLEVLQIKGVSGLWHDVANFELKDGGYSTRLVVFVIAV